MKTTHVLFIVGLIAIAGCDNEGVERPPPTEVRIFHGAPAYESIGFLREERAETTLELGGSASTNFDSGQYDFHLEYFPVGSAPARPVSFSETLSPDLDYTFVQISPGGVLDVMTVTTPDIPTSTTTARFTIIHAHPTLAGFDAYLVPPGTPLAGELPDGSASFGPTPIVFEVPPGGYHLYLTPVGDPNTVLFESEDFAVAAGDDGVLVVSDPGDRNVADFVVTVVANQSSRIDQIGLDPEIRMIHGIDDDMPRDLLLDDDTTTPLIAAQPVDTFSPYVPLTSAGHILYLTPVGTPGTIETQLQFVPASGRFYTAIYGGNSVDGIEGVLFVEDARAIAGQATLRLAHVAGLFDTIDVFIAVPGTDINTVNPFVRFMNLPSVTPRLPLAPGTYEMTLRDADTSAILSGPTAITLAEAGVYGFILLNGAGGSTVDVQSFYDTP